MPGARPAAPVPLVPTCRLVLITQVLVLDRARAVRGLGSCSCSCPLHAGRRGWNTLTLPPAKNTVVARAVKGLRCAFGSGAKGIQRAAVRSVQFIERYTAMGMLLQCALGPAAETRINSSTSPATTQLDFTLEYHDDVQDGADAGGAVGAGASHVLERHDIRLCGTADLDLYVPVHMHAHVWRGGARGCAEARVAASARVWARTVAALALALHMPRKPCSDRDCWCPCAVPTLVGVGA